MFICSLMLKGGTWEAQLLTNKTKFLFFLLGICFLSPLCLPSVFLAVDYLFLQTGRAGDLKTHSVTLSLDRQGMKCFFFWVNSFDCCNGISSPVIFLSISSSSNCPPRITLEKLVLKTITLSGTD